VPVEDIRPRPYYYACEEQQKKGGFNESIAYRNYAFHTIFDSTDRWVSLITVMDIGRAIELIAEFTGGDLTSRLSGIEHALAAGTHEQAVRFCNEHHLDSGMLQAAFEIKSVAGCINDIVHALGILVSLPKIINEDEKIISMSLGAGNTGRLWDLETDQQVAEFKLIRWQGGPESIRQNGLFKDFFCLAEHETDKARRVYVLGLEHPMKFLLGGRSIDSVISRNATLAKEFRGKYGDRFACVREYFAHRRNRVELVDLIPIVPELAGMPSVE